MSADVLVRMVLFAEGLLLAVGVAVLLTHAVWWWWYDRWSASRLAVVRAALRGALAEGDRPRAFTRDFSRLPMRLQIYLLAELAPNMSGTEQQALRRLARTSGLLTKAERLCRSWFWSRRLFGAKICMLVGHPADVMLALLDDRNSAVRGQAVEWAVHRPDARVIQTLLRMLGDRDGRCRFAAQDTLVRVGHAVIEPLIAYMRQADHEGLLGALDVALTMGDARLLEPAAALVDAAAPAVRARAVALLGALGGERGLTLVTRALEDPAPAVRIAALRALAGLAHWKVAPRVAGLLHDAVWDVRRQAALCLRAFGAPGVLFLRRLRDSHDAVAAAVARYALDLEVNGVTA